MGDRFRWKYTGPVEGFSIGVVRLLEDEGTPSQWERRGGTYL